jgi:FkbM family methyltransferase
MRSKGVIQMLTGAYSLVRKTGILEVPMVRRGFVASSFAYKKYYEDPFWGLAKRMPQIFQSGDVLDIGANIGYTAWVFSEVVASGSKVYAFEPDGTTYAMLEELVRTKKLAKTVEPLNMAVGSEKGFLEFWHNKDHSADHRVATEEFRKVRPDANEVTRVPVTTVDDFVAERKLEHVSFVKIDVQGYETAVCQGMSRTLEKFPGMRVCLEFMPDAIAELGFEPSALLKFFEQRGYRVYALTREALHPVSDEASIRALLGSGGYVDLLFSRDEIR